MLLLADTRSDKTTLEALTAGLRFFGAEPMALVTEPIARYGAVPQAVFAAMHESDVVIWVWPVFITFTPAHRAIDNHVMTRVQRFLAKRHRVPSRGTRRFPRDIVFGELGVLSLRARQAVRPQP